MPRRPALVPNEHFHITIEPALKQRLDLILFSDVEQRIPRGSHKEFFEARLREWLTWKKQPLELFGFPAGYFIAGPSEMVEALVARLEQS